jgi:Rad3-related DNA helicase
MNWRSPEQSSYARLIKGALQPGPPLLAGAAPGLGKTHGYSIPLIRSGQRVAISLSTRQLIDQYLASEALRAATADHPATVVALQTRRHFEREADYQAHRVQALAAQVLVVTHAAALIDSLHPGYARLRERSVVLFDEADLLADAADLQSSLRIAQPVLQACDALGLSPEAAARRVHALASEAEDRAAASAILHALAHPAFYKVVGYEDDGALALHHRMPGRMLKPLLRDLPRAIFTSGTLPVGGRFEPFMHAIGLTTIAPESRHIDPARHGQLRVEVASDELDADAMARRITTAERPTLVLTPSHALTDALAQRLPGATARRSGEALTEALQRCPADGVLIAASAWSGLDDPRLRWKTVVIPKTPYGPPVTVDGQTLTRYIDSLVVALRRTQQGLHRGLRTPDASCTLLLLDPRSSRAALREAIPARFPVAWEGFEEGAEVLQQHLARERNASLRAAALKHHGARCMEPGCGETTLHRLDVHHTRPIAEGERRTQLSEVIVLCKNHHADAHHRLRMAALEAADAAKTPIGQVLE